MMPAVVEAGAAYRIKFLKYTEILEKVILIKLFMNNLNNYYFNTVD